MTLSRLGVLYCSLSAILSVIAAEDVTPSLFSCANTTYAKQFCFNNSADVIKKEAGVKNPEECCSLCSSTEGCHAWDLTWQTRTCRIYKAIGDYPTSGNCVMGWGADMPPKPYGPKRPSAWIEPPANGPICKDCPNIIFSLTDDQVR